MRFYFCDYLVVIRNQQIQKYKIALKKCLKTVYPKYEPAFEIVCLLGSVPNPKEDDVANQESLKVHSARYVTYDGLIQNTLESYDVYLQKEKDVERIRSLVQDL